MKKIILSTLLALSLNAEVSFKKHIAPILKQKCESCHGAQKKKGGYGVDTFTKFMKAGKSGLEAIVPKDPVDSYLYELLISDDEDERMPQKDDKLSKDEIKLFEQWIAEGAKFDGDSTEDKLITMLPPPVHPKPPKTYPTALPVFTSVFSPDGKKIYSAAYNEILVWDLQGKLIDRINGLPQTINSIVFSSDANSIYVGGGAPGEYGEITQVNIKSKKLQNIAMCEDVVLDLKVSPDGTKLISGGADSNIRVFDLKTQKLLWRNKQHAHWVTGLAVSDYSFFEEQAKNQGLPDFLVYTEFEKKGGEHNRQIWKFNDRTIIREANWQLEFNAQKNIKLSDIRETGIGKTREVKTTDFSSAGDIAKHIQVINYLRQLDKTWASEVDAQPFLLTSSFDKTVKVFNLKNGLLFTTYKGHSKVYGKVNGHFKVYSVVAQKNSLLAWSAGGGKHLHGWNPVLIRDEDGTAGDMEARFAKEGSAIFLRHDFKKKNIFKLSQEGDYLWAVADDGSIKSFKIPFDGKFNPDKAAENFTSQLQDDYLMSIDIQKGKIITSSFNGTISQFSINNEINEPAEFTLSGTTGTSNQMIEQTKDANSASKWCLFHENKPVVWQAQYQKPISIDSYELSSAGDVPNRDPREWLLEGSNDGQNWTVIDRKANQAVFPKRRMMQSYELVSKSPAFTSFRFTFKKVNGDNMFQLSEIKLNTAKSNRSFAAYPQ
jgi:WD40 repeat protein